MYILSTTIKIVKYWACYAATSLSSIFKQEHLLLDLPQANNASFELKFFKKIMKIVVPLHQGLNKHQQISSDPRDKSVTEQ